MNYLAALINHIYDLGEATNVGTRFEEVRREDPGGDKAAPDELVFMVGCAEA